MNGRFVVVSRIREVGAVLLEDRIVDLFLPADELIHLRFPRGHVCLQLGHEFRIGCHFLRGSCRDRQSGPWLA